MYETNYSPELSGFFKKSLRKVGLTKKRFKKVAPVLLPATLLLKPGVKVLKKTVASTRSVLQSGKGKRASPMAPGRSPPRMPKAAGGFRVPQPRYPSASPAVPSEFAMPPATSADPSGLLTSFADPTNSAAAAGPVPEAESGESTKPAVSPLMLAASAAALFFMFR